MGNDKNVAKISDQNIRSGIDEGRYRKDGVLIRDISNGQILKVIKSSEESVNGIPSTLIQINNTIIYQADLQTILKNIAEYFKVIMFENLEEEYHKVLDCLALYCSYGDDLKDVHVSCRDASISFGNKIKKFIDAIKVDKIDDVNVDVLFGALDAYIKILFIYIASSYLLQGAKFKSDKVIIGKIIDLESCVRSLYERLLAELRSEPDGSVTLNTGESLYSMYLFDVNYDVGRLDRLVKQDSRFNSALDVVALYKKNNSSGYPSTTNEPKPYPRPNSHHCQAAEYRGPQSPFVFTGPNRCHLRRSQAPRHQRHRPHALHSPAPMRPVGRCATGRRPGKRSFRAERLSCVVELRNRRSASVADHRSRPVLHNLAFSE